MGAADTMLIALLALADLCLMIHLRRRRQRVVKVERMMKALRRHIQTQVETEVTPLRQTPALVLQRAS